MNDKPLQIYKEDNLYIYERVVKPILKFIDTEKSDNLTIAVTGKWGIGKTSAINILKKELYNNNRVIIEFEPILEGKQDLKDIIEVFYLKLYSLLSKTIRDNSFNEVFTNVLKSLAALAIEGTNVGIPPISFNIAKKVKKIQKIWKNNEIQLVSQQLNSINELLKKHELEIIIIIDEIDRLPAINILNILMFTRILENIEQAKSLICFDYEKVITKLRTCPSFPLNEYHQAEEYLDKLFYIRFHIIHYTNDLMKFTLSYLKNSNLAQKLKYDFHILESIVKFLETPRQIKKWIKLINLNKDLLMAKSYEKDNIPFIIILAVCTKHPLVHDNISNNTLDILYQKSNGMLELYLSEKYNIRNKNIDYNSSEILIESMGFETSQTDINITSIKIPDHEAYSLLNKVFFRGGIRNSLLALFIYGVTDKHAIDIFYNYFDGDTDKAIKKLLSENNSFIVSEIHHTLVNLNARPKTKARIKYLNDLWNKNHTINPYTLNLYYHIILSVLYMHDLKDIFNDASFPLLAECVINILKVYNLNIKNKFNLSLFNFDKKLSEQYKIDQLVFNDKKISEFKDQDIKNLIDTFTLKCNKIFSDNKSWANYDIDTLYEFIITYAYLTPKNISFNTLIDNLNNFAEHNKKTSKTINKIISELESIYNLK